jgi:putative membrane protein
MTQDHGIVRGALNGMVGGLVASWVMNEFFAKAGSKLQQAVQTEEQNRADDAQRAQTRDQPQEDATMKTADRIVQAATGGQHLSWEGKKRGGPAVHYAFGALIGALYGGLAEMVPGITAGAGSGFGTLLFVGADLLAVPALGLSSNPAPEPASKLASPFAAHLVYGVATDSIRKLLR